MPISIDVEITAEELKPLVVLARRVHRDNEAKGFWTGEKLEAVVKVALIMREGAELLEEYREPAPRTGKTGFPAKVEEAADILIRTLDLAAAEDFESELVECMLAKIAYNRTRPVRHGKNF